MQNTPTTLYFSYWKAQPGNSIVSSRAVFSFISQNQHGFPMGYSERHWATGGGAPEYCTRSPPTKLRPFLRPWQHVLVWNACEPSRFLLLVHFQRCIDIIKFWSESNTDILPLTAYRGTGRAWEQADSQRDIAGVTISRLSAFVSQYRFNIKVLCLGKISAEPVQEDKSRISCECYTSANVMILSVKKKKKEKKIQTHRFSHLPFEAMLINSQPSIFLFSHYPNF